MHASFLAVHTNLGSLSKPVFLSNKNFKNRPNLSKDI